MTEEKLCPGCGNTPQCLTEEWEGLERYRFACFCCIAASPHATTRAAAIDLWNAMPVEEIDYGPSPPAINAAPATTSNREPGFYWTRTRGYPSVSITEWSSYGLWHCCGVSGSFSDAEIQVLSSRLVAPEVAA